MAEKPKEGSNAVPEYHPDGTPNLSEVTREERRDKAAAAGGVNSTGAKDNQAEAERINREEALYRGGFPVAGHDPGRERTR